MRTNQKIFTFPALAFACALVCADPAAAQTTPSPTITPGATPAASVSPSPSASPGTWDPFLDMQRMQTDMNTFFQRAMQQFNASPAMQAMHTEPGFSSSLDVRDKGDHYEVDAYLPGAEINNVKVTADSNNLLRVTASQSKEQKKTTGSGEMVTSEFGEYSQLVRLPGPAKTKEMKIERKDNEVVITIPKKK